MQLHPDGTLVVSATDLVGFLECDHLATLELGRARGLWKAPPHRTDPTLDLLRQKGEEHEQHFLERQRVAGRTITEIPRPDRTLEGLAESAERTVEAMRHGDDVIFQATLFDGRWLGYADFLLRVERSSAFGPWSYEVADTKLSRAVKGGAVLQVCVYSDLLARIQGTVPEEVHVVTGDGAMHAMRLDDYAAYYRAVKRRFEREIFGDEDAPARDPASATTYPDPVEHCKVCTWYPDCADWRRTDDHLSIVAGLARTATEHLNAGGIWTRRSLAVLPPAQAVPDLNPRTLARLREQAAIQVRGEDEQRLIWELVPPDPEQPDQGLARLPEPSRLDLFFDIEADPWAAEDGTGFGLEYLLGVVDIVGDKPNYTPIWGTDRDRERVAFERFIDLVVERRSDDPGMHVFHYGGYESGAVKRLMQRHATRAEEVDQLLRGEVFVDLLAIVRQGVRASVESYSLKRIEKFYMSERTGPVTEAGFSVVEFEAWLADGQQHHLDDLAAYNADDCVSTLMLRDWLENLRRVAIDQRGWSMPRPTVPDAPGEQLLEALELTRRREERLREGISADMTARTADEQGRWLLSRLIDWHRREDRPQWWNWYRLRDMAVEELVDEREAVSGLEFMADVGVRARSTVRRYRFPPQETKLHAGDEPFDPDDGEKGAGAGEIVAIDLAAGTLDLVRGPKRLDRHPVRLIPAAPIGNKEQRAALGMLAEFVLERGVDADGPSRAGRDLLLRRRPRLRGGISEGPLVRPDETAVEAARRLALEIDGGVLGIQGPPGTGKTWTGARMIVDLLRSGRRVGVTAQAHKAITNMLGAIDLAAIEAGVVYRALQRCDPSDDGSSLDAVTQTGSSRSVGPALAAGTHEIAAGTPWLFAREDMRDWSMSCSSTRPARCRSPTCSRWPARRDRSCCSATRISWRRSPRAFTPTVATHRRWNTSSGRP